MKNANNSLAHTTWNCKYHIVFAPKYRRQAIYGKIRADIGKMLRMLCQRKGIEIIEPGGVPGTGRVQLTEKAWRFINKNSH